MIKGVQLGKEIVVTVANKVGVLADMSRIAAESKVNIEAVAGYAGGSEAKIMLVTNDNACVAGALKKAGYSSLKEGSVVLVDLENKIGALKGATAKLAAEHIDIKYIYGAVCSAGCPSRIVISSDNNEKAIAALKK